MIQDVDQNIALLKQQKQVSFERLQYYKSVLDANSAEMEGGAGASAKTHKATNSAASNNNNTKGAGKQA